MYLGLIMIIMVIMFSVVAIFQAIVLRWAARKAQGLELSFGAAYLTVFVNFIAGILLLLPLTVAMTMMQATQSVRSGVNLLLIPLGYVLQAAIIRARHGITFHQALKIVVYMFLLGMAIAVAIMAVFMVLTVLLGAAFFASRTH